MKVVFLDCDGVINGYGPLTELVFDLARRLHLLKPLRNHYKIFGVHKRKVKLLAKIVKKTNTKIVLSSSWRLGWELVEDGKCISRTKNGKLLRDELAKYGIEVYSKTEYLDTTKTLGRKFPDWREDEIIEWLSRHKDVESFVVLDDEDFDLQSFVGKELVLTSKKSYFKKGQKTSGLKPVHVKKAIKILNKER